MIEVTNISKSYGKKQILKDISFKADAGERVVIVGRNGCGKTTLLKILAGAMEPDGGNLNYFGENPLKNSAVFRKNCGYVPQENPLMEELSVLDNLRLWGFNKNKPDEVILEQFELGELLKTKVSKLSGGMKRRVSLACGVIEHPGFLIMDEPTAALDIYYRDELLQWLRKYQNNSGIVLMTTHEESEIIGADHCYVMRGGTLFKIDDSERDIKTILDYTKEI